MENWENKVKNFETVIKDKYIINLAKGKKVLHLGATDFPFTEWKAECGALLQQKLMHVSENVLGIDNSKDGIRILQKYNITNVICADIADFTGSLPDSYKSPDVIICGDILEHVIDIKGMMTEIIKCMGPDTELVISTVNACSAKIFFRALFGREAVHPDHVAYYSYTTAKHLVEKFGLKIIDFKWFSYGEKKKTYNMFFSLLRKCRPVLNDAFLMVCKKNENTDYKL